MDKVSTQKQSEDVHVTALQKKLQKFMSDWYCVQVTKFDAYHIDQMKRSVGGKEDIDEVKLRQRVNTTPIEDLGFDTTAMDLNVVNNVLQHPLFIEIKELRNVSQPFQRGAEKSSKDDADKEKKEKKRQRTLKNQTYQFKAHDGKRLIKIILLFQDQDLIVRGLNEANKFRLYDAYLSPAEPNTFVIDVPEQIELVYNDKCSSKLEEEFQMIQGLPLKYTNAPRFVFLNESAGEEGEKQQQEQEDELADLFKAFDVTDLTSSERTYIKRFEQLGFWRKKFPQKE